MIRSCVVHKRGEMSSGFTEALPGFALGKDGTSESIRAARGPRGRHGYATLLRPTRLRERETGGRTLRKGTSRRIPLPMCRL